ncbi:hypothetical protein F5888DRAFT_1081978 [Russula emetica]|nr:hypothetical protein F5888DRAFT_1081978 [Russula emetica]
MIPSPVNSARNSSLSTSSNSTIPSKSSHTSIFLLSPSSKPDENSLPTSAPPESMNGSSRRWSPHVPNKRKRDSEFRGLNGLQLREAQEKVAQKRAKIAARVPAIAGNARPVSTSLADLYAQMRRDSGASGASGQQPTSSVIPSTNTVPGDGRILNSKTQNAPRGHSTSSSPDPIAAISEDDQEIVMLKHIPGLPRRRAIFNSDSETVLDPPTHSKSSPTKDKSKTSTPKSAATDGVPKLSFAVVVPSPPKRSTYKPTRVERGLPERDSSQLQYRTSAAPDHVEKSKENTNDKVSEPFATHTPTPTPALARPTRSLETIPDSTLEYGMKRSRRGIGLSEDLTARDLDMLLDAVPLPFDFSLARRHLASREKGENDEQSEENSLWWYHPIFEARAKADIRRTLSALLPSDPAQDPPSPIGGASGWKAEVRPRQSKLRIWAERLENAFGPGPLDRGLGRKPRRVARPAGAARREAADSLRFQNGVVVIPNSHRSTPRILEPPSRRRSPKDAVAGVATDEAFSPLEADDVALVVDAANAGISKSEAAAWTAALLPLVKGKILLDKTKIARTSDALGEVERANQRGNFAREVLKVSKSVKNMGKPSRAPTED